MYVIRSFELNKKCVAEIWLSGDGFRCLLSIPQRSIHRVLAWPVIGDYHHVIEKYKYCTSYLQSVASLSVQGSWLGCYQGHCSIAFDLCVWYIAAHVLKLSLNTEKTSKERIACLSIRSVFGRHNCKTVLCHLLRTNTLITARITFICKCLRIAYRILHHKKQFNDRKHDRTMQHAKYIMH